MKKLLLLFCFLQFLIIKIIAQVGISASNTTPNASAMLDVSSNTKGILIPRMSTSQKNAISNKAEGLMVYDTDLKLFSYWIGSGPIGYWTDFPQTVASTTNYWKLNGSDISSNNVGNVGIGITNPTLAKFQVIENTPNQPVHSAIWANNTSNGNGITGNAFNSGIGVWGTSGTGTGVEGRTTGSASNSYGVFGNATGSGTGGYFSSASGNALVTGNGNVGISVPLPVEKLDVEGNIKTTGEIKPNGVEGQLNQVLTSNGNGTMVWAASQSTPTPTYAIGDISQGGIVFYVTPDFKHGLVAATKDQFQIPANTNTLIPNADWYTALENIKNPNNHDTYGKNFTDWRLPTRGELLLLSQKLSFFSGFVNWRYWTSQEYTTNPQQAYFVTLGNPNDSLIGFSIPIDKTQSSCVRAIRSF